MLSPVSAAAAYLLDVGVGVEIQLPADVEAHPLRLLARVFGLQLHHRDPDRRQEAGRGVVGGGIGGGGRRDRRRCGDGCSPGPLQNGDPSAGDLSGARSGAQRGSGGRPPRQPAPLLRIGEGEQLVEALPGPELRFNLIDILQSAAISGHFQSKRAAKETAIVTWK